MRFTFTKEQDEFRNSVESFLESEIESGNFTPHVGTAIAGSDSLSSGSLVPGKSREFSRKLAERGWIGMTWPKRYGGQERTYVEKMILNEALFKVRAPVGYHFAADRQVGPALIMHGTEWQKEFFLPKIINAEEGVGFCLLFSEPNAGSDLSSCKTNAIKEGDEYILNGQKVWTSGGHDADFGWLLARTEMDPNIPIHKSFSEFMINMKTEGITVRPIINSAGVHNFNEVFLDDVRIHKKYLVGKRGNGFKQIMAQVDYERAGVERILQSYQVYKHLMAYVATMDKSKGKYAWTKDKMAQFEIEFQIGMLLCYHVAWKVDQGEKPTTDAALCKLYCTEFAKRLTDFATKVVGYSCIAKSPSRFAPFNGDLADGYLWCPSYTLQGGSGEVLKNIIALRGLKLPRK